MSEKDDRLYQLLHADRTVDRQLERLEDVQTITAIIHDYRKKGERSSEIALAIVKFVKEG